MFWDLFAGYINNIVFKIVSSFIFRIEDSVHLK